MRRSTSWLSVFVLTVTLTGCRQAADEEAAGAGAADPPFMTDFTIKELMLNVLDRQADVVWLSVSTVASEKGLEETRPTSDEEWERVRAGAVTLAEAANLLMIPGRRTARPGEKSEVPGVELEPEEMDELIAKDRAGFNTWARALYDAAKVAAQAAEKQDPDKIFEIGEQIEYACEGCHKQFWYPNEVIPELPSLPDPPAQ